MRKIAIIGGGFCGTLCAKKLQNDFEVTLIDSKDYFEFTPSILRTIVNPGKIRKIQILHKEYLNKSRIIIGRVKSISRKEVFVSDKKIPFDYLIIASGSKYSSKIKSENLVLATRAEVLKKHFKNVKKSKSVLIIGGGLVGIEIAAEICTEYPKKKITLVHAGNKLIERNHPKAIDAAENFLEKKVRIIKNERVTGKKGNAYVTDKGTEILADVAFLCTGITPNCEFMKKNFSDKCNEKDYIKVNSFLQLEGLKNIFAGGDVCAIKEEKTAQSAEKHAKLIVKNIFNLENSKELEGYKSKKWPMVISLGKYNGIFENKGIVLTGIIPAIMKWFVEKKSMWKRF